VNPGTLVIRADASVTMGTGHVMRCLALAQAWQDAGGNVIFAMAESTPAIARRLRKEGAKLYTVNAPPGTIADAIETISMCQPERDDWMVIDGYHFNSEYQRKIKSVSLKLLLIDDHGQAGPYSADLVLNHNPHASEASYRNRDKQTRLLLGSSYALVRREFRCCANWYRAVPRVAGNVLVTFGGSDPHDVTTMVLRALQLLEFPELNVQILVGSSNPHLAALTELALQIPRVHLQIDAPNMPELMSWADIAVTAGGGTCYELALMHTPMVLITMADNHNATCSTLQRLGAAVHLGRFHDLCSSQIAGPIADLFLDPERRRSMIGKARRLIDGNGPSRVIGAMLLTDSCAAAQSSPEPSYAPAN
jgi:UDP-2,4-diacetamido-2,4,6-trideoxy-beta-L-altropyranose hydrolase